MKTLVTGGAGFIGSNLVGQLLEDGHEVAVLDNYLSGFRCNLTPFAEVRVFEGDIRDNASLGKAIEGAEVVFHLAASVGNKRSMEYPLLDADINVMGTLKVLEAARRAGVRKVVASSSAAIFGELKVLPIREDHPAEPDSPYGCTKLCMEKECLAYSRLYPLEVTCLRYFNVYGTNQRFDAYGNVIPIFVFKILRGEPLTVFGDGEQTRDFLNVRDAVQANIKAAKTSASGVFNIASGRRITVNTLVETLRSLSGMDVIANYAPPRQGDVLHSLADIGAARESLGYEPQVLIEDGLREYIAWAMCAYSVL